MVEMNHRLMSSAAVVIAVVALVVASPGLSSPDSNMDNTISVSGNSEVQTRPDKVEILVNVDTKDKDVNKAQEDNRKKSDRVMQALKDYGIDESQIQTTDYNIRRQREHPRPKVPEEGKVEEFFQVVNTIKIESRNIKKAGEIVDTAVEAGANGVESVSFTLTKEKERAIQDRALKKAADMANKKASSLAASLGIDIGKAVKVAESSYNVARFDVKESVAEYDSGGGGAPSTNIEPKEVTVDARITAEYKILGR